MTERSQYTMELQLRDNRTGETLRIAVELPDDMLGLRLEPPRRMAFPSELTFDGAVALLKQKQFRKDLFKSTATRLGHLMAERMEDAEGWHDTSRIEPASKSLGGKWPNDY